MELRGKHVLILGLGESGLASALWCARQGARVRVADTRAAPPYLEELHRRVSSADFCSGEFDKALLDGIDLLVLSPGLSGGLMVVIHARAAGIPVVGEIELFAQALRSLGRNVPVLAITRPRRRAIPCVASHPGRRRLRRWRRRSHPSAPP